MARTKAFDTNEILHKAMNIFGNRGYEGTSLPDLITGLGIARQSIYDTYGTKWELFFAAVKHYMDQKNQELRKHCEGPGTVVDKVELVFTTIIKVLVDPEQRLQCFIISSAIEQAPHNEELAAYLQANTELSEQIFYTMLEQAVTEGEIGTEVNIRDLARFLVHERIALITSAKLGMDEPKLLGIMQMVLSVFRTMQGS
ncbi:MULTISPECIES: TetR/AcrR family transcriptional regulator [Paenibacillus]|uniref:TetR/AcrR family transcriptional regulator n=1 Tax=Paenibacillus TaxID=44249 RepID=UPI000E24D788|nr:TetR/AcrR family transcriptional regulator [Paenibacillus sp. VMFN-D1]MCM2997654.1 TetR/AcrR family transcriptional regulator [Paenibacillus cellulositrophicus]RED41168.1 TetR family transcriptional regulator [Paenibacillus sp. VMFN-D1]